MTQRAQIHDQILSLSRRYGLAVLSSLLALLLTLFLSPLQQHGIFVLFFAAVLFCAWYGGFGPGLLATALASLACAYFLLPPFSSLKTHLIGAFQIVMFALVAGLISWLTSGRASAERALRQQSATLGDSEKAQKFLADASAVLGSSLDYGTTLRSVARLAVPVVADWCVVDILENSRLQRLAVEHTDPAKLQLAHDLKSRYADDPNARYGIANVLRTGQPEYNFEISDKMLEGAARDAEHLAMLRQLGLKSYVIMPLVARGQMLGAITFVTAESGRRFGSAELRLAEELARRAAVAVDNARLFLEAEQANRLKDDFLATLSHELRTPLHSILGWTHILRTTRLEEAQVSHALEIIERSAKAQARIIADILDVSRIITGKVRLELRPVKLAPVIAATVEAMRPTADAKGIRLETVLDGNVDAVMADSDRLQQVSWNLLSNAIKFTPQAGRVEVRLEQVDWQAQITFRDSGIGISPEFFPYLFNRFRQADPSSTRVHGGLGLGLALVRHLVEAHGGTVEAESPGVGQGATFRVRLPIRTAREEGPVPKIDRPGETAIGARAPLQGLKVLVVDDEADARELVVAVLEQFGASVFAAASAGEALELISREQLDVLLADIGMPGEDGYSLIAKIRALGPARGGGHPGCGANGLRARGRSPACPFVRLPKAFA